MKATSLKCFRKFHMFCLVQLVQGTLEFLLGKHCQLSDVLSRRVGLDLWLNGGLVISGSQAADSGRSHLTHGKW